MNDEHDPHEPEKEKENGAEKEAAAQPGIQVTGKGCIKPVGEITLAKDAVHLRITDSGRRGWEMNVTIPNEELVDKPKPQKTASKPHPKR